MKKIIVTIIGFLLLTSLSYACVGDNCETDSNVKDSNDGNKGYIFVYDCEKGNDSVGEWVDPKSVPELKGDKGDKGDTGATGKQGIQGLKGDRGEQGIQGVKGEQGIVGKDGKDGLNGIDGSNGKDGNDGKDGLKGEQGDIGEKGEQGIQGLQGVEGIAGKDVDPKEVKKLEDKNTEQDNKINNQEDRINKLEETQYVLETSFRILDTKKISLRPFFRQNFNINKIDIVGLKVDVKLGKSYEEKLIEKINVRLDQLDKIIGNAPVIERTIDTKGNVKSINIKSNGLSVNNKF